MDQFAHYNSTLFPLLCQVPYHDDKSPKTGKTFPRAYRCVPESHVSRLPILLSKELESVKSFKGIRTFCREKLTWECFNEHEFEKLLRIRNAMFNRVFQEGDFFDTGGYNFITMTIDQFAKFYAFVDFMYTQRGTATRWANPNTIETAIWSCCFGGSPKTESITATSTPKSSPVGYTGEPPKKKRNRTSKQDKLCCPAQIRIYVSFAERLVTIEQTKHSHNHTMVSHYNKAMSLILKLYCRHQAQHGLEVRDIKQKMAQHFEQFGLTGADQATSSCVHNAVRDYKLSELTRIERTDPTYNKELSEMLVPLHPGAGTSI